MYMKATVNVLSDGPEYLPVLALNSYYIKESMDQRKNLRDFHFMHII